MASSYLKNSLSIRSTRFFMRFTGFWIWNDRHSKMIMDGARIYSTCIIMASCYVTLRDLWFSKNDFQLAAYTASIALTVLVIGIKLVTFLIKRDTFLYLIKYCHENFWECEYDTFGKFILNRCEKRCGIFILTFTVFAQSTLLTYVLRPLIHNIGKNETDRILLCQLWVDLPITTTPYYEIAFFTECLATIHSAICYFCFDNFLCIMNVHTAGQFKILQRRFELLCSTSLTENRENSVSKRLGSEYTGSMNQSISPYDQRCELMDCVRKHQSLIDFIKKIEEVYTIVILAQVILFSLLICLVSYEAFLADGVFANRMIFIVHSAGTFTQLFMFTLTCDDLMRESEAVAEAAYRTRWYHNLSNPTSRNLSKDLIIVMMRSRRSCSLTAAGFFPVSLETFTTILSTALSYLTLLRQSQANA